MGLRAERVVSELGLIPHPEGGQFLETFRSGSLPMKNRGQTDLKCRAADGDIATDLVIAGRRADRRPDGDCRRNCLTSIFWLASVARPTLRLSVSLSDHVHYWQGGRPFEYVLLELGASTEKKGGIPSTEYPDARLSRVVLGPNISVGHRLQVPRVHMKPLSAVQTHS